jgi:hypothetical protein
MVYAKVGLMKITETFHIRRYWLNIRTPDDVLDTLNWRWGNPRSLVKAPYVDINYHGDSDKMLTMMELKYAEWIDHREEVSYTVEGYDGLGNM